MQSKTSLFVARWGRRAALAALAAALVMLAAAWILDRGFGHEVLLVAPHDPSAVALNRSLWIPGEPVAELYGSPMSEPIRVLSFDDGAVLHPAEDPSLALLPVGGTHPHPLQARTIWFFARFAVLGFGAAALLAAIAWISTRHRAGAVA